MNPTEYKASRALLRAMMHLVGWEDTGARSVPQMRVILDDIMRMLYYDEMALESFLLYGGECSVWTRERRVTKLEFPNGYQVVREQ